MGAGQEGANKLHTRMVHQVSGRGMRKLKERLIATAAAGRRETREQRTRTARASQGSRANDSRGQNITRVLLAAVEQRA